MSTKGEEFFVELTRLRKFVMLEACALPGWLLTLSHQCLLVNMLVSVKLRLLPNVSSLAYEAPLFNNLKNSYY